MEGVASLTQPPDKYMHRTAGKPVCFYNEYGILCKNHFILHTVTSLL
jgi:hypothetical protein